MSEKKSCFFVTPIGATGSPQRIRADKVQKYILEPALGNDFSIVRADEVDEPGEITRDIVLRLYQSDLVVADLTGQNANVMYEIGLRHCFNKPMISICQQGEPLPFDLAGERTTLFDISDLGSVDEAKKRISGASKSAFKVSSYKSSVLRILEHSDLFSKAIQEPASRTLVDTMEDLAGSVQEMQGDLVSLEMAIDNIELHATAEVDPNLENKLDELLRLFSHVGPNDISRLAEFLKHSTKT